MAAPVISLECTIPGRRGGLAWKMRGKEEDKRLRWKKGKLREEEVVTRGTPEVA